MRFFVVRKLTETSEDNYVRTFFDPEEGPSIRFVPRERATWFAREKDALNFGMNMMTMIEEFETDG